MCNNWPAFPHFSLDASYINVTVVKRKLKWSWDNTLMSENLFSCLVHSSMSWTSCGWHTCVQALISRNRDTNLNTADTIFQHCWPFTTVVSFLNLLNTFLHSLQARKLAKSDEKKTCTKSATTLSTLHQTKLRDCSLRLRPHFIKGLTEL